MFVFWKETISIRNQQTFCLRCDYRHTLKEEDEEAFKRQFNKYISLGIRADDIEELYKKAHVSIRSDPTHKKSASNKSGIAKKRWNAKKFTLEQRDQNIIEHKAAYIAKLKNEDDYSKQHFIL